MFEMKYRKWLQTVIVMLSALILLSCSEEKQSEPDGCGKSDIEKCNNLGDRFKAEDNYKLAVSYYKKACENGSTAGCVSLGVMYLHGEGVWESKKTAKKLFRQGCEGGNALGCIFFATALNSNIESQRKEIKSSPNFAVNFLRSVSPFFSAYVPRKTTCSLDSSDLLCCHSM
jgi:TPR repeat protein